MVDPSELAYAMLSAQGALLGEVTPALRAVSVKIDGTTVTLTTTFDGEHDQDLWDAATSVAAQVIADYPSPWMIDEVIRFRQHPTEAYDASDGKLVFLRKEARLH